MTFGGLVLALILVAGVVTFLMLKIRDVERFARRESERAERFLAEKLKAQEACKRLKGETREAERKAERAEAIAKFRITEGTREKITEMLTPRLERLPGRRIELPVMMPLSARRWSEDDDPADYLAEPINLTVVSLRVERITLGMKAIASHPFSAPVEGWVAIDPRNDVVVAGRCEEPYFHHHLNSGINGWRDLRELVDWLNHG